jgi:AcrR family transcriptional regulator
MVPCMSPADALDSRVRARTRAAILSAAATVLARYRSATLPDIADAAGVGRTTLHRYFPERDLLIRAAIEDSFRAIEASVTEAALDQGPALEAMRRLVAALVQVGDRLRFLFGDPHLLEDHADAVPATRANPALALIERGQGEGAFNPDLSPEWIQHVVWAIVYTACEEADRGRLPRHSVAVTAIRTLENGIR